MNVVCATWPAVLLAVCATSCYNSWQFTSHITAVTGVCHYFKSTVDCQIHFNANDFNNSIQVSSLSESTSDSVDNEPHRGHGLLKSNGAILWESWMKSLNVMFTLEEKLNAYSETIRDVQSLQQLQQENHGDDLPLLPIMCGNWGALVFITMGMIQDLATCIGVWYYNSHDLHKH